MLHIQYTHALMTLLLQNFSPFHEPVLFDLFLSLNGPPHERNFTPGPSVSFTPSVRTHARTYLHTYVDCLGPLLVINNDKLGIPEAYLVVVVFDMSKRGWPS